MFQFLSELDKNALLAINGFHFSWLDQVMIFWSEKLVWLPFYALLLFQIFRKYGVKGGILFSIGIALGIILSDQVASALLKPLVQRPRPCHEPEIQALLYLAKGCGGQFGFASSHASNSMFVAIFCTFLLKPKPIMKSIFVVWVLVMAWSRMYLGAHYPGDILAGWFIGGFWALLVYHLFLKIKTSLD